MTIREYLVELERRLPRTRRRRFLAEAEEHLRDAAQPNRRRGLDAATAERAAIESFGDVGVVARRLASEAAVWETRIATALALGAASSFVLPLYVVPENTLPPATWVEKPRASFFRASRLRSGSRRVHSRLRARFSPGRAGSGSRLRRSGFPRDPWPVRLRFRPCS